jgi:acyl-CoA thioesterase-1
MKLYGFAVLSALLLAGCGKGSEPVAPSSAAASAPEAPVMGPEKHILALGDSLFAGYGVKPGESYPAKLELALRAHGVNARIANAGVSGDTSAGGLARLAFTLNSQRQTPDLVIISLGGNDMLRGLSPEQTKANLDAIYPALAERHHVSLVPFFLKAVIDKPDLIQADHIHPTARGIEEIVAATTYAVEGELVAGAN